MKTISTQEAVQDFDEYSELAHHGERILVTRSGRPWVLLSPPAGIVATEPAARKPTWPDFAARLAPHYPKPIAGPTAAELLAQDKEDRF
jgi:antitoxin (DNA-binding transcriptional repressor) of toxin-antitoxin stability system